MLIAFALFGVIAYWFWSDDSTRAKCIFTIIYLMCWGLRLVPFHGLYLFPISQAGCAIYGLGRAFGIDWLMQDRSRWF